MMRRTNKVNGIFFFVGITMKELYHSVLHQHGSSPKLTTAYHSTTNANLGQLMTSEDASQPLQINTVENHLPHQLHREETL